MSADEVPLQNEPLLVEVRIPTYKRKDLLQRSLQSLLDQTYRNWRALIFDDSPEGEAQDIVEEYNDHRFIYRQNERNLGMAGNIDQCFQTKNYIGGEFAFVLEDDNVLYPDFISSNLQCAKETGYTVIRCDQEYWI